ncbi:DUF4340 domain-containing protein [Planctomicrobium piriforme]|uniref:DUF4340 domain-containing protein n=1 Tax=Planctomicrobium piriforme TaxID=1576369 RepID=A0A1I3QT37_9PLAN|nr:DUF4340 domain-containing protein [Planctomicrobium piriforme]SFJ37443.1 protein of unknown function [Planctomicrobium piriforme]
MNQTAKTLIFVAVAAVSVVVAAGTYYSNRPVDLDDFSDVGDKFYPNFDDPNVATGLQVSAYDDATGKTEIFKVEYKDGLWRIPSHHDYPADAQDKLAKTAASMVGVIRQALVERSKAAHKRYDLVDPLEKDASAEGRGDRITLYKGDETLVDFIVGKKVENSQDMFNVRRADEDRIYMADLGKFDVTTKFSDWIKKDVLEVTRDDIKDILIGRYYVDEAKGKVVQQGQIELLRDSDEAEWQLKGLKPETEKLKTAEVNSLLAALDELQIVGVRPKPEALSSGLKTEGGSISIDPFIQQDMAEKGVFISGRGEFVYNEGKVDIGTGDGVMYELGFGEEFAGNDIDIEVGQLKSPAAEAKDLAKEIEKKPETPDAEKKETEKKDGEEKADDGKKKSRYLFVTVFFDKQLLGPAPVAPVKPEPPVEKKEEPAADKPAETPPATAAEKKPEEAAKPEEKKPDPKEAYQKALEEYKLLQEVYDSKQKAYDDKVKAGEKRVAELNRRFADWYYVISEDLFDRLKLKREDLVEKVEPAKEESKPEEKANAPAMEKPQTPAPATDNADAPKLPAPPTTPPASPAAPAPATPAAPAEPAPPATPPAETPKPEPAAPPKETPAPTGN